MALTKVSKQDYPLILEQFERGKTLSEIGGDFDISRERVRQILKKLGCKPSEGAERRRQQKLKEIERAKDEKCQRLYGCSVEQFNSVSGHYSQGAKSPLQAFKIQRINARERGVEWKLSFWDWWCLWDESGHWNDRGRGGKGYCMCRNGDEGAYEVGNVYIGTVKHNSTLGKTLAIEKEKKTSFVHKLITSCGGPSCVAKVFGFPPNYISQLAIRNYIPAEWFENGRVKELVNLSHGKYSASEIQENINHKRQDSTS
ncbi:sigma factor-like helix-turn-helix DNA-binding protein [Mixta calida]|uniref:sigma factor-like helix-turn-helix DNA-binding protein n=1 Tax=Mixta calida TaxID=665913 RepID=UPI0028A83E65|nr:sigma factor-like helix-turn-helix DNA-binding protein [Mixta calida]